MIELRRVITRSRNRWCSVGDVSSAIVSQVFSKNALKQVAERNDRSKDQCGNGGDEKPVLDC